MSSRILVLSDRIGRGDDELGRVLIRSFFYSLARTAEPPVAVMFMNDGVRLACAGSDVINDLRLLAEAGVAIRSCGTCLDFLGVADRLEVGSVGAMPDSVAALMGSDGVITIT